MYRSVICFVLFVFLLVAAALTGPTYAVSVADVSLGYTLTDLGAYATKTVSAAWGINDSGTIVGTIGSSYEQTAIYADGAWQPVVGLSFEGETPQINDLGWVVQTTYADGRYQAALWLPESGVRGLGVLPSDDRSNAIAVNNAGTVVGNSANCPSGTGACYYRPFIWDADRGIRAIPGFFESSYARDVNDQGLVVGDTRLTSQGSEPFLWSETDGVRLLGFIGAALKLNTWGQVVGIKTDATHAGRAFVWSATDGLTVIEPPSGEENTRTEGWGINDLGEVVGRLGSVAFVWDRSRGFQELPLLPGGNSAWPLDINNNGQIVGRATDSQGRWRAVLWSPDPPRPPMPAVNAAISIPVGSDTLFASWTCGEPWDGTVEFAYAVWEGSYPQTGSLLIPWTSVGTATSAVISGLDIQSGSRCYILVKATGAAGQQSRIGRSAGTVAVVASTEHVADAKMLRDGQGVAVTGAVVSSPQLRGDRFYIQSPDRAAGIGILAAATAGVGDVVDVAGRVVTRDGERLITDIAITTVRHNGAPAPLHLSLRDALSAPFNFDSGTGIGQPGLSDERATNLSTVGLLVRVVGQVMDRDSSYIYINDGTWPLYDTGARVDATHAPPTLNPGDFVSVTGISSIRKVGSLHQLLVLPRSTADIETVAP